MEVRCPRDPGLQSQSHPQGARTPDWPTQARNPATSPPSPGPQPPLARPPTPSTHHSQAQMARWKENYTISPRENDPETGEGGKGTLRTLLQTKHSKLNIDKTTNESTWDGYACSRREYRWPEDRPSSPATK